MVFGWRKSKDISKSGTLRSRINFQNFILDQTALTDRFVRSKHYKKLQKVELRRRRLLRKTEDPAWKVVFNWHGTIYPIVFSDALIWISLGLFLILRITARRDDYVREKLQETFTMRTSDGKTEKVDELKSVASFLGFFLVFYCVQNNTRYMAQYDHAMKAKGAIFAIASLARAKLNRSSGLKIVRYLNASYAAAFVGLSDAYTFKTYFLEVNRTFILLTSEEVGRIRDCDMEAGGSAYRELLQWVQVEIAKIHEDKRIDDQTARLMHNYVIDVQSHLSALFNYKDQPLIFFYIHLVVFITVLYLPLNSIEIASRMSADSHWISDVLGAFLVCLNNMFVSGLRELGKKLSDPFGLDYEDLSVMHYVAFTWRESARILGARPCERSTNDQIEEDIVRNRTSIGSAWDPKEVKIYDDKPENGFVESPAQPDYN